jgi:hypothetical protein
MASYIFQRMSDRAASLGIDINSKSKEAMDWLRKTARVFRNVNASELMREANPDRFIKTGRITQGSIGKMVMFFYDPKTKAKLPYYDRFPVIFPIEVKARAGTEGEAGFLGINMHYLSPTMRGKLMAALYTTLNNKAYDENKRLKISYDILKQATKFKLFRPCIKHYLYKYVRSRFLIVSYEEWDTILFLPTERFEKGGRNNGGKFGAPIARQTVWTDSMRKVR